MVATQDLKSCGFIRAGSSPATRTRIYMILVVDNLLPKTIDSKQYSSEYPCLIRDIYSDQILISLWNIAKLHYDLTNVVLVEKWVHTESSINSVEWHVDEDVKYKMSTGITRLPQCTMIYYPFVAEDLLGGWFCTHSEKIRPVTNRAIIFDSSIQHTVEPSMGARVSMIYNPWNHEIETYNGPIA